MTTAQHIRVSGVVQGVGFRPFVWRLARDLELCGWVRNDSRGVEITAEGPEVRLYALIERLRRDAPPRARVDAVIARAVAPEGLEGFRIVESISARCATAIGADTAVCADCLAELFDPAGRRWRHAFITCTHCGPRYTIARGLPYDRSRTSMSGFALCADCGREYADPADRRFHAEPIACPNCGPQLRLLDGDGLELPGDPIAATLARLQAGAIVAIKGLGGYHLVCDARNGAAVATLRARKDREAKPLAVMAASPVSLSELVALDDRARQLLSSPERPIMLAPKRRDADTQLPGVAPGLGALGVMLPTTPLQWLLFHEDAGRPAGLGWLAGAQPLVLVMTSANPGGEPLVTGDAEALERLAGIADAYLQHDREIVVRCDDSVVIARGGERAPGFVRRARGYTPQAIRLAAAGPAVLAVGAFLKNTVCVTRADEAFVSQHIGDLDDAATLSFFEESIVHLLRILEVEPQLIAHDLHPDFPSTNFAAEFGAARGIRTIGVQHHHAHVAAVLAEHRFRGPVLGLALDGIGLGSDGGAWGGELLIVDGAQMQRAGHLATLPMPGGDRAAREPWRMAAAALHKLGRGAEIAARFPAQRAAAQLAELLDRGVRCPPTSSAGRLFDAAAALLGVAELSRFEAEAAMRLEALAGNTRGAVAAGAWRIEADGTLDLLPLLGVLADSRAHAGAAAALFHATLAAALSAWIEAAAECAGIDTVVLCGGCLLNGILRERLEAALQLAGLRALCAINLPPNDGAISVGQAWVALCAGEV
ncbi:MAG: carbamoyltransferase HypF [Steroidobacteraceae bacterium]|jgi:hydrogenase maturation protein HypF